ncbi:hypothetical protein E2C01_023561 [Portunus trituberculatus]|uniref:Uncharacterized protein n=1 Tax=Portunus trituberculatus TaxID=210409 RepID=A0A5B7E892_PORTR|nr:hypothetical protein [Portunus trituberculatus]
MNTSESTTIWGVRALAGLGAETCRCAKVKPMSTKAFYKYAEENSLLRQGEQATCDTGRDWTQRPVAKFTVYPWPDALRTNRSVQQHNVYGCYN